MSGTQSERNALGWAPAGQAGSPGLSLKEGAKETLGQGY